MFKKCFSTLGCPADTLEQVLQTAQSYQMDCVEIRALENEINLPAYFKKKGITPEQLKQLSTASGIDIAAFNSSLKLTSDESEWIHTLDTWAPWILAANAPALRVFDGANEGNLDAWMETAKARAQLWKQLKVARGWQFDLIVETHDTLLTAANILQFVESTERLFPILWDAHHTWRTGGEAWATTWQACREHVQHIHIKDSLAQTSATHAYTYTDLGKGEMNPEALAQLLSDEDYTGVLSLEWERMWHPELAPLGRALSDFRAILRRTACSNSHSPIRA